MRGSGGGGQFGEFEGFCGQSREAFLVGAHCLDGGSCFGELASTGCTMVADEEEKEDGEDEGAADDAARDARFCGGCETGAIGLESVFQGE